MKKRKKTLEILELIDTLNKLKYSQVRALKNISFGMTLANNSHKKDYILEKHKD